MEPNPKLGQRRDVSGNETAGIRTPSEGGSSSSNANPSDANLPSDAPTLLDFSPDFTRLIDGSPNSPVTSANNPEQKARVVVISNQRNAVRGAILIITSAYLKGKGGGKRARTHGLLSVEPGRACGEGRIWGEAQRYPGP